MSLQILGYRFWLSTACLATWSALAQEQHGDERGRIPSSGTFLTDVPSYCGNVIQGRPTDQSITVSVLLTSGRRVKIAYGEAGRPLERHTDPVELNSGEPRQILLSGLHPDCAYEYRVLEADTAKPLLPEGHNGFFHTCRPPGSSFVFTMTADSHLDENSDTAVFRRTLGGIRAVRPDFHIDLGDTFMTGKHRSRETALRHYLAQRYYFGLIGDAMPVFLVLGNHDGEETARRDAAGSDGSAVWSCLQRKRLFPNPEPDAFYSGNLTRQPYAGLLADYYAWTWGDALFVVLDPYWTSLSTHGGRDPWAMSLGKTQYDWLCRTLRSSKVKFKFVFIHQLVGGLGRGGRGGAEAVPFFEWGGHEQDGRETFAAHRKGWDKPVHDLLVETGVSAVFHGHDHFFAHQERDGIIYQLVPQPAHPGEGPAQSGEYGYTEGEFFPSSGFLRVAVTPASSKITYVRARQSIPNGADNADAFSYTIAPKAR